MQGISNLLQLALSFTESVRGEVVGCVACDLAAHQNKCFYPGKTEANKSQGDN
ncbi:hypothetical protein NIES4101_45470 [Calothrix sp. NIES-4101]|nr:hypothetical protein NIES4101_45470 [Calothrix sp. NIES-4101]